jgi:hypothetical protein
VENKILPVTPEVEERFMFEALSGGHRHTDDSGWVSAWKRASTTKNIHNGRLTRFLPKLNYMNSDDDLSDLSWPSKYGHVARFGAANAELAVWDGPDIFYTGKYPLLYHIVHSFPDDGNQEYMDEGCTEYIANVTGWQVRMLCRIAIERMFFKSGESSTFARGSEVQLHPDNRRFRFRGSYHNLRERQPWMVEFPMVQTHTDGDSYYVHVPSGAVLWGQWTINTPASSIRTGPDDVPWTMCCALLR